MNDIVVVRNTITGEVGDIRRRLFESSVFNPNGLLIEIEDLRGGCVDCGIEPCDSEDEKAILEATASRVFGGPQTVEDYNPDEEED